MLLFTHQRGGNPPFRWRRPSLLPRVCGGYDGKEVGTQWTYCRDLWIMRAYDHTTFCEHVFYAELVVGLQARATVDGVLVLERSQLL